MQRSSVGFAGDGWGAVSAVRGLQEIFNVQCFTTDTSVSNELSKNSKCVDYFDEFECQIIVCAGYRPIINKELLIKYDILNIHYSLLPTYRGLHSTAWAIMNGEEKLGLSIFKMNKFIDDGPLIHQKEFVNDNVSSAAHYMNLMNQYIEENVADIIFNYNRGSIKAKEQDKTKASWVGKRTHKHNLIDFEKGFEYCRRLFRVLQSPYPSPQIRYKKNLYSVGKVTFHPSNVDTDISRILNIDDQGVWIKSKGGYIILDDITNSSGKKVNRNFFKIGSFANT